MDHFHTSIKQAFQTNDIRDLCLTRPPYVRILCMYRLRSLISNWPNTMVKFRNARPFFQSTLHLGRTGPYKAPGRGDINFHASISIARLHGCCGIIPCSLLSTVTLTVSNLGPQEITEESVSLFLSPFKELPSESREQIRSFLNQCNTKDHAKMTWIDIEFSRSRNNISGKASK